MNIVMIQFPRYPEVVKLSFILSSACHKTIFPFQGTIADSEFVENQIRQYEMQQKQKTAEATNNATVYNLRIDKFVIDGKIKQR